MGEQDEKARNEVATGGGKKTGSLGFRCQGVPPPKDSQALCGCCGHLRMQKPELFGSLPAQTWSAHYGEYRPDTPVNKLREMGFVLEDLIEPAPPAAVTPRAKREQSACSPTPPIGKN